MSRTKADISELTQPQLRVYLFIAQYYDEHGYMPSSKEISIGTYSHVNTVLYHMRHLLDKGFIETDLEMTNELGEYTKTAWGTRGYRFPNISVDNSKNYDDIVGRMAIKRAKDIIDKASQLV